MSLIYEEHTGLLRRCFFDVQNEVGLGRDEESYHQACVLWLQAAGIPFCSKQPHRLYLGNEEAHTLFPDLVVWDAISVELKAVPRKLAKAEFVQLFDYLKCRGDQLGLLVNLGLDRVHVERVAYQPPIYALREDWRHWQGSIQAPDREVGAEVRKALANIYREHQTGYGDEVTRKLILFELTRRGLAFVITPVAPATFLGQKVGEGALDCFLEEARILLVYTALFDDNQFNISRGLSFMKSLGISWGVAVNFGREVAEITGLRRGD